VATLVGLEEDQASIWQIYSESVKPFKLIQAGDEYGFYESIVDTLRPIIRQGVRSVLVAAPDEKDYEGFMNHIRKHHGWLLKGGSLNTATFEHVPKPAADANQVRDLIKSRSFKEKLTEVSQEDIGQVVDVLEEHLNDPEGIETLLFTLREAEDAVHGDEKSPEYILVTELFRARNRRRTDRLLQVAANKGVKTRIIKPDTPAGARISQFGGLVCLLRE
jgi:stalled ribosome rescue protein Dom34